MKFLTDIIPNNLMFAFGDTLISSIWQSLIIAFILFIFLKLNKNAASKIRYNAAYIALCLILVFSVLTFAENVNSYQVVESSNPNIVILDNEPFILESSKEKTVKKSYLDGKTLFNFITENRPTFVLIWFIGMILLSLRALGGLFYTNRIKYYAHEVEDKKILTIVKNISDNIGLKQTITILESAKIEVPAVMGIIKPVLLLPLGSLSGIPCDQLEMIIRHELAHIKRSDYLLNIIQTVIEIIFFFNPIVWWISSTIKEEREYCCDDVVNDNFSPAEYAKALASLAACSNNNSFTMAAKNNNENQLFRRINRMLTKTNSSSIWPSYLSFALIAVLFSLSIIACSSTGNDSVYKSDDADFFFSESEDSEIIDILNYDNGSREISIHQKDEFDDNEWEIHLEDGKITKLYLNGDRLSKDEVKDNEDYIFSTLEHLRDDLVHLKDDMKRIKFDLAELELSREQELEELEEALEELEDIDFDEFENVKVNVDFDDEFNVNVDVNIGESIAIAMRELHNALEHVEIKVDGEEIEIAEIAELEALEALREIDEDIKIDLNFDMDELKVSLHDLKVEMDHLKEGIHFKDLKRDMQKLKEHMHEIKYDLKRQKRGLKGYKRFMHKLKDELYSDGYIDDPDEDFSMFFNADKMNVNGIKISSDKHEDYKELYKDCTGKDFDDDDLSITISQ